MLCDYSYRTQDNKIISVSQVEVEDFKKFFQKIKYDVFVESIAIALKEKENQENWWIWQRPVYVKKVQKFVGGWQHIGNLKSFKNFYSRKEN